MERSRLLTITALAGITALGCLSALPLLALAFEQPAASSAACGAGGTGTAADGTPSIIGASVLTVADLRVWWTGTGRSQPSRLRVPITDLIATFIAEGDAEGVRGDLAFVQAVHETGYFTNSDTARNNFAGIAHYDGTASGSGFSDPVIGVRAQIQLLKKFALGNNATLVHPNVAPKAGATAGTWGQLAGTWASDRSYWTALNRLYQTMSASRTTDTTDPTTAPGATTTAPQACGDDMAVIVGGYTLPVDRSWYDQHPDWFARPHHDYPAVDIPVPIGTPVYAVTNGVIAGTPVAGKCGIGIILNGDDGAQYTYCHGGPGTQTVSVGERVTAGQLILHSASTGNSTGPHLHFGIEIDGTRRCPQALLEAIAENRPVTFEDLGVSCTS
jgi:murein DD-endopeptidase MepM/ murein hydrolase activator NlpD